MKESYHDKVEKLIAEIITMSPLFVDIDNGGYEYSCPFCHAYKLTDSACMDDLKHDKHCAYVMAKTLYEESIK